MKLVLTLLSLCLVSFLAVAQTPEQEARANAIAKEIRCPTCVAQSVSESDASLSQSLRRRILSDVMAGKTDAEILENLTRTYGDNIRLMPKMETRTLPLWLAPWIIISIGAFSIFIINRRRRAKE